MLAAGIRKFKCATIAEAEMLAQCGAPDVLLAYQPLGPQAETLCSPDPPLSANPFFLPTDNSRGTEQSNPVCGGSLVVPVYIDLDVV